jgi:Ca2+:H+ antiporter
MGIRGFIPAGLTTCLRALEPQTGIRFFSVATHDRRHGKRLKTHNTDPAHPTWQREWFLGVSLGTCLVFFLAGTPLDAALQNPAGLALTFVFLFAVILGSAMSVVRHAEHLAVMLGQPYGTLVLTLSVTFVEVASISAVMLHGENNPTLVRDTLIAVVMIILNGMVGLSLLVGALKHEEQHYNLQGANTYLCVILPLAVLTLVLPDYTTTTTGPTLSTDQEWILALISVGLYLVFLALQTGRHRGYFMLDEAAAKEEDAEEKVGAHSLRFHVAMLLAYILPVVYLAERLAHPMDYLIETLHVPAAIGGVAIALLVATPEAIGATRAALANQMQRSVNIFLGSVLSTIGLTVPVMLAISNWTAHPIVLGVEHGQLVLLLLTLVLSILTFESGRTNVLQGLVHLLLFIAFLGLLVQG